MNVIMPICVNKVKVIALNNGFVFSHPFVSYLLLYVQQTTASYLMLYVQQTTASYLILYVQQTTTSYLILYVQPTTASYLILYVHLYDIIILSHV